MSIGESGFFECFSLADVYYAGTEAQWKTISVGIDNDSLLNATTHYGDAPAPTGAFIDVPRSAYYAIPVAWAVDKGIIGGFDDGGFRPDELVTRAQAMTFLWRAEGSFCVAEGVAVNGFKDVSDTAYYYKAVLWAVAFGITGGYDSTTFGSMDGCTRAQIVTFLYRTMAQ